MLQTHVYIHDVHDGLTPNKAWFQRKLHMWNEFLSELATIINGYQEGEVA